MKTHRTPDAEEINRTGRQAHGAQPVELRPLTSYKLAAYDWLWPGWIARKKMHLLAGVPGIGKTTLLLKITATITTGGEWPDGSHALVGDVALWSGEDTVEDTLLPRLLAAGADLDRVKIIHSTRDSDGSERAFNPALDMDKLSWSVGRFEALSTLIIDPMVATIEGDSHNTAEVRRSFQPLINLTEQRNLATIGNHHFAKNTKDRSPIDRVLGAVAFAAAPRVVMAACAAADPGEPFRLTRAKSNIGPTGAGFEYQLVQKLVRESDAADAVTVSAQYVDWGKSLEGTPQAVFAVEESKDDRALLEAIDFLSDFLAEGERPFREIEEAARAHGHAMITLRRAKSDLGVIAIKTGLATGWAWKLPERRCSNLEDDHHP